MKEKKPKKFSDEALKKVAQEIHSKLQYPGTTEEDVFKLLKQEHGK